MSLPPESLVHAATVEPYTGSGAYGDVYGAPFSIPCYVEQQNSVVIAPDGDDTVASATLYADLGPELPPGSKVTYGGRTMRVITVAVLDDGGEESHLEVALR